MNPKMEQPSVKEHIMRVWFTFGLIASAFGCGGKHDDMPVSKAPTMNHGGHGNQGGHENMKRNAVT